MVNDLDYKGIEFPVSKKDYSKIEQKTNVCITVFCYENNLVYPVYVSDQNLKIIWIYCRYQIKISHIMCILKILIDLCVIRQNARLEDAFANIVYNILLVKEF